MVNRITSELAAMDLTPDGLKLIATAPGVSEDDLHSKTGVAFTRR